MQTGVEKAYIHFYVPELLLIACIKSGCPYKQLDNLPE